MSQLVRKFFLLVYLAIGLVLKKMRHGKICSGGDVVIIYFPYSDLSAKKRRPALVVKKFNGNDLMLCQITSQTKNNKYYLSLNSEDFNVGVLSEKSSVRLNRIFTADERIIVSKIGRIKSQKLNEVINKLIEIIKN